MRNSLLRGSLRGSHLDARGLTYLFNLGSPEARSRSVSVAPIALPRFA